MMKLKLDENLGSRGGQLLRDAGHDVATVLGQDLCSAADATLAEVCRVEGRVLISMDKDFANTLRFRPSRYCGLVVLRLSEPIVRSDIEAALQRLTTLLANRSPIGKLWIVDDKRIREFVEDEA